MRLSIDDGSFGVVISPWGEPYSSRFLRYQLIVEGQVVGDRDDVGMPGGAIARLMRLHRVDDPRLRNAATEPAKVQRLVLRTKDANLHDRTTGPLTESTDGWAISAWIQDDAAVWLARRYRRPGADRKLLRRTFDGKTLVSVVPLSEYTPLAEAAVRWAELLVSEEPTVRIQTP